MYLNNFENIDAIIQEFHITDEDAIKQLITSEVLYATYNQGYYAGDAFVLFRADDGKLYEVNGSHCSCYGLEDQWTPEETFKDALQQRRWYFCDDSEGQMAKLMEVVNAL